MTPVLVIVVLRLSPCGRPEHLVARERGCRWLRRDLDVRQHREERLRAAGGRGHVLADRTCLALAGRTSVVERALVALRVEPAELEAAPTRPCRSGASPMPSATVADVGAGGHQGPERRWCSPRHRCCRRCRRGPAGRGRGRTRGRRRRGRRSPAGWCSHPPRCRSGCSGPGWPGGAEAERAAVGADVDAGQAAGAAGLEVGVPAVAPDGVGCRRSGRRPPRRRPRGRSGSGR